MDGTATVRIDTTDADERTYTIRGYHNPVQSLGNDGIYGTADDDILSTAAIGEIVTIRGTISAGETVDILIEDGDVAYFDDALVDENKEFKVDWDTNGLTKGSYTIDVYIDCDCSDYDCIQREGLYPDGLTTIRLIIIPELHASISKSIVPLGESFDVYGSSSSDYVEVVAISPEGGGGTGLDGLYGVTIYTVPTFSLVNTAGFYNLNESLNITLAPLIPNGTTNRPPGTNITINFTGPETDKYNFYKRIKVDDDADTGNYTILVLSPGIDGVYGDSLYKYMDTILDLDGAGPELGAIDVSNKTKEEIVSMIKNVTINRAGSDDLLKELYLIVGTVVKENLIINGDFSDGLNNWTERGYGRGNRQVEVVYEEAINSSVLEFKRWNSGADGGMEGVYQKLSINVNEYKSLYLEADIKVISNTLSDSGWWSYVYGGDGEFPVHIFLYYKDENGTDWVWTHGFLPVKDYWNRRNYDVVTRNEWYHYVSPNLVNVSTTTTKPHNVPIRSPPPKIITGIFLGGKGWDFCGRIDNVKLYGEKDAAPTENIFDTGESPNPYPSIFGTHNGTIVPANDITVSKIFVYPCVGTGGHAEYVRIWGNGVDAHATWNGYGGEDWNILHFNRTFTLEAGKEYNFTIKTGSYPQIFHEEVLETLDGSIVRCEEFVDANGKRHKWIPAFKIYA